MVAVAAVTVTVTVGVTIPTIGNGYSYSADDEYSHCFKGLGAGRLEDRYISVTFPLRRSSRRPLYSRYVSDTQVLSKTRVWWEKQEQVEAEDRRVKKEKLDAERARKEEAKKAEEEIERLEREKAHAAEREAQRAEQVSSARGADGKPCGGARRCVCRWWCERYVRYIRYLRYIRHVCCMR